MNQLVVESVIILTMDLTSFPMANIQSIIHFTILVLLRNHIQDYLSSQAGESHDVARDASDQPTSVTTSSPCHQLLDGNY